MIDSGDLAVARHRATVLHRYRRQTRGFLAAMAICARYYLPKPGKRHAGRTGPVLSDPISYHDAMSTWVPMPCPVEGCGYIAQFQLEKTQPSDVPDPNDERARILHALSEEHQRKGGVHPGGVDAVTTTEPAPVDDDGT